MSINLINRIFTSLILLSILFLCLFVNKFLWTYLMVTASIILFYEINNLFKKINRNKIQLYNFVSIFYLIFFIYSGFYFYETSKETLVIILFICISSDTGGYIIGKMIGGKKLTKISPNKTISGSIGSFFFSLFPITIAIFYFNPSTNVNLYYNNILILILISLILSLICQLGDLFISFLKRKAKIKDTGSILPGHGGLLDRVDGLIFVLPFSYILDRIFL